MKLPIEVALVFGVSVSNGPFLALNSFPLDNKLMMVDFQEFIKSLEQTEPPELSEPLLEALWLDGKGNWEGAHNIVQDINGAMASWIHAYLHRKEGDLSNAGYWYSRAGKSRPSIGLDEEWELLVKELI